MSADAENAAKLSLKLDATGGGWYDQIVPVSQGMLNDACDELHNRHPLLNQCQFVTSAGNIKGNLLPPRILIPKAEDQKNVYWQIRFRDGNFRRKTGQVPDDYDMTNWIIAVKVPLALGKFEPVVGDSEHDVKLKQAQHERIAALFKSSGRYTAARLYAVLADARWLEGNIDFTRSSIVDQNKVVAAPPPSEGGNPVLLRGIRDVFRLIAKAKREGPSSTISPESVFQDGIPGTPTNPAPVSAYQNHSYRLEGVCPDGAEGLHDPASRNCLLFGQVLGKSGTDEVPIMQHTGNFSPGLGKTVWALHSKKIFNSALLSNLQSLLWNIQVRPQKPQYDTREGIVLFNSSVEFRGYIPDGNDRESHPDYALQYDENDRNWKRSRKNEKIDVWSHPSNSRWHTVYKSAVNSTVQAHGTAGKNEVIVSGHCRCYWAMFSVDQEKAGGVLREDSDVSGFSRDTFRFAWNMSLAVTVSSSGVLAFQPIPGSLKIDTGSDVLRWYNQWDCSTPNEFYVPIVKAIREHITSCVQSFEQNVTGENSPANVALRDACVEHSSRLNFSNPVFSNNGDLLVEIKYKSLPSTPLVASHALYQDRKLASDE